MEPPSWVILVSNNHHYKHGTEKYISKHSDGKRSSQNMNHPRRREKTQSPHHSSPCMSHGGLPWHQVAQIFFSTRCFIGGGVPHVWTPKMKLPYKSCLLSTIEDHSGEQVQSPRNSDTGVWGTLLTREDHCTLFNTFTSINGVELTLVTNIRRSRSISENTEHSYLKVSLQTFRAENKTTVFESKRYDKTQEIPSLSIALTPLHSVV